MSKIEHISKERPLWDSPYLRPEWRLALRTLFTATAPFEELYRTTADTCTPEDMRALMDMLQSAGALDEAMRVSSTLPATIERTLYEDWARKKLSPDRQKEIVRERERVYKTLDLIIQRAKQGLPLARLFLQEGTLIKRAMEMVHSIQEGRASIYILEQEIMRHEKNTAARTSLINALHLGVFGSHTEKKPVADLPIDKNTISDIELYSGIEFLGTHLRHWKVLGERALCRVDCRSEEHPFIFGTGEIHINGVPICFWISRFHGDLLVDGTTTARIDGIVTNPGVVTALKKVIWGTIQHGIENGKLTEVNQPAAQDRFVKAESLSVEPADYADTAPASTSTTDQYTADVKKKKEDVFHPSELVRDDVHPQESTRRLHIHPLKHRQFIRTLVRCGATIESGGKHLIATHAGRSFSVYNPHLKTERLFRNVEIHAALKALDIPPELFLAKL